MKYGVHLGGGASLRHKGAAQQIGRLAEDLGYDGILTGDHITIPKSISSTYPYHKLAEQQGYNPYAVFTTIDWLDAFTVLGLLVPVTEKVRLGPSVIIVPYRHPLDMARVIASLDVASGGRIVFGVGVGWMEEEFQLLGVPYKERASRTREYIQVMKEVWTKENPRFNGKYVHIDRDLHFAPKPHQKPHPPIWVGGESEAALKRVVEFGDGWHIGPVSLEEVKPKVAQLREMMAAAGRNFSQLEVTSMVDTRVVSEADIRTYRDLGVTGLYVVAPGPDPASVTKIMREFAEKVKSSVG